MLNLLTSLITVLSVIVIVAVDLSEVHGTVQPGSSSLPMQSDLMPAPQYCTNTLDGKSSCLEDYGDNVVILNVWATWCIPCREEMPALENLYKEFSKKGLEIIGVSVDSPGSQNRIKTFVDRMEITYTILHDPDDKFARAFRTVGVPESFLINQQGQIVHTWRGPFDAMSQDTITKVSSLIDSKANINVNSTESNYVTSLPNQQVQNRDQSSSNYQTIGYPVAFVAGILSFLSPCILPLIPSYVAFITGMSMDELTRKKKNEKSQSAKSFNELSSDNSDPNQSVGKSESDEVSLIRDSLSSQQNIKHIATVRGLLFIAGFSLVFILLGASITAIGSAFSDYTLWIERAGGVLLVIFGLHLFEVLKIPIIQRDWAIHFSKRPIAGHLGSFVIGMGFGAGWTPCIGPILASILTIAASSNSVMTGVNLLAVYSAGLAIPFIISTIAIERFLVAFRKFRRWLPWVNRVSAALLIVVGIILLTGFLTLITGTLSSLEI